MSSIELINNHIVIRNTVGYDLISQVEVYDLPEVLSFLRIVDNYTNMRKSYNSNVN